MTFHTPFFPVRQQKLPQAASYRGSVALLALAVSGVLVPSAPVRGQIVADGNTATSVTSAGGGVTNIHTSTISAGHGVNTFSSFSTASGSVTNIHVPNGAAGTVNIVNGPRSVINGAVNSVAGGQIGGDMYFANPAGIVVGPNGGFHGGTVALSTPSQDFVRQMIQPGGGVHAGHVQHIVNGTAPLSQSDIVIHGQVRGQDRVSLQAGGNVHVQSGGRVSAQRGNSGGTVHVRAGHNVRVADGAVVLAEGEGAGKGGTIDVFARDAAILDQGGRVSVAAYGTGDGGFVEFSAEKAVEVHGLLQAWSAQGRGGTVFIDPEHLTISGEITSGATFAAEATASITVVSGAVISTRNVGNDVKDDEHNTASSTGHSGDIRLTAPNITVESEAQLLAFADNGYDAGDIILTAARIDSEGHLTQALPVSSTSIRIERAYLHAGRILISAETVKSNKVDAEANINDYLGGLIPDIGGLTNTLVDLGQQAASRVQATLDAVNYDNWPSYLEARAEIGIDRSVLRASNDIRISSNAVAETEITPDTGGMALVIAASNTVARTIVTDSMLITPGNILVESATRADHTLRAEGVPGSGLSGLNTALVASVRLGGAETVVGKSANTMFIPPDVTLMTGPMIKTGGAVEISSANFSNLDLKADTRLGENGRGAAIVLSLDDRKALTAVGGMIWSNSFDIAINARNRFDTVVIDARVTGGALEADDAPDVAQDGQPAETQAVLGDVLAGVASGAEAGSGVGEGAGITQATQGGDMADRAYAAAFALANHNATAEVVLGGNLPDVQKPSGGSVALGGLTTSSIPARVWSGGSFRFPTIPSDPVPAEAGIAITAENILIDVRQSAIAAAGAVPEAGTDPDSGPAAKKTALIAVSFADWDLDATVHAGPDEWSGGGFALGTPAGITITARNVAPDFANRDALDDAHDLYSGKRQAESPAADGESENAGAGDAPAPNAGGLIGAWSDGEGPLFARADDAELPLALSVAQTFAAGEALGVGVSLARLSGDQSARVVAGGASALMATPWSVGLEPGKEGPRGAITLQALQSGAWGASAGAPDGATSADEGGAYGASIALVNIEAITESVVNNGAYLESEDNDKGVTIEARDTRLLSADARTHGAAGKTAFSGAFSLMQRRDITRAMIAPRAFLDIEGAVRIRAVNSGDTVTVVSANAVGQRSIGVGIALTFADRETVAGFVGDDLVSGGSQWAFGDAKAGGVEITAENTGNVISGGRTKAGEAPDAPAGETPPPDADADEDEDEADTPVALDAEAIGEDSNRVAEAIGGSNPLGGGGGGGNEDEGGLAFAGDFGAIFSNVVTEAMIIGRNEDSSNSTEAIHVDVEGAVTVSARTDINYGQSSAVTAAASGGMGISGSFGLTWIEHDTSARIIDSDILFGALLAGQDKTLKPVRVTSADESRFDLLVDGRAGRADDGWSFAIAASFARFVTLTETELTRSEIRLAGADGPGDLGGFNGWFYDDSQGWYNDGSGDWEYSSDGGWYYEVDRGWYQADWGGYVYVGHELEGGINLPPGYCEGGVCGPTGGDTASLSPDGREIIISSLADPTLTIRATSERTGPAASGKADQADAQQMDGVGDLVRDAGTEARKKEGEGGLKGLSITVAPLRQIADASVIIDQSLIEAQLDQGDPLNPPGNAGKVEITSRARTNVDIDARSDTIAVAIAITDTLSHIRMRRSDIQARGNGTVQIVSRAEEKHKLRATAGAERAIKAAGVLSLRNLENRVLMDAEAASIPSGSPRTLVLNRIHSGDKLEIAARTDRDIDIEVIAADGTPSAVALAAIISLADAETEVAVGADLLQDGGEPITIEAVNTWTRYSARAIASAGTFVPGAETPTLPADGGTETPEPAPERDPSEVGQTATALLDVADDVEAEVETPEEAEGTPAPGSQPKESAARKRSFAIAFALDLHNDTTLARISDVRMDGDTPVQVGFSSVREATDLGAAGLNLLAENRVLSFTRETRAAIGFGDSATPTAGVFAVGIGNWRIHTDASVGQNATVRAAKVNIKAATILPTVPAEVDRSGWFDEADGLFARGAGGYAAGDERPKSADELVEDGGWNIITSTHTDAQKLGVAIDVSISRVVSETTARLIGTLGTTDEIADSLTIEARTEGGLASRRDPEGNTTTTSGGSGAGGSGHVLLLRPETRAILSPQFARAGSTGDVTVTARNTMVAAVSAVSYGRAEKFGLNIGFALIDYNGTAEALVLNPDRLRAASLTIDARDSSILLANAGSSAAGNTSFGVSGALIFADRTVTAEFLGTNAQSLSLGDIKITALADGAAVATSVAGAGMPDEDGADPAPGTDPVQEPDPDEPDRPETPMPTQLLGSRTETNAEDLETKEADAQGENSPVEGKQFGFALAGDFSGIFGASVVRATLNHNARIDAGNVDISADTTGPIFASAGSTVGGAGKFGIGASAALNGTRRTTRARLNVSNLQLTAGLARVVAQDATDLRLMAAGRGGAAVSNSVLGSAAVDFGRIIVSADIAGGAITQAKGEVEGDSGVIVRARNAGRSLTLAGALKLTEEEEGNAAEGAPEGGGDGSGGVAVGLAFAGNFGREDITASLRGFVVAPSVSVIARSVGRVDGLAASTGGAGKFSLTGAAVVTAFNRHVEAYTAGGIEVSTEEFNVLASDRSDSRLRVGSDSESGDVSIGAAAVIAVEKRTVIARMSDTLTEEFGPVFPDITVSARQEGNVEQVHTGGGSSEEGVGISAGVGVLLSTRTTHALIENSTINAGSLNVLAAQEGHLRNRQGVRTDAGDFGGTVGVMVTALNADVAARVLGGNLFITDEAGSITAIEESRLLSRSAKTGSADNGADIMVATATIAGSLVAEVDGASVVAPSLSISARDESGVQASTIARASTSGFGAVGGVGYAANRLDVAARLTGGADGGNLIISDALNISAVGESTLTGTVVGLNMGGGDFAGSLQVAWLTANRDVIATAGGNSWAIGGDTTITARRADTLLGIGATAQEGGASVGIAGNVLQTGGRTLAGFVAGGTSTVSGDLSVNALDESRALNVAVGAASGGGGFSAVGSLAYIQMGRKPEGGVAEDADDRAAGHEAVTESVRDELAADFADSAGLSVTDLQRRFDLAIEAQVQISDGGTLSVGRNTRIEATDNRVATAIAGQLQVQFDVGGAAENALDRVTIDENGVSIDIKAIQGEGTDALMNFALFGGGGSDEDAGISESSGAAAGERPAGGDGGGESGGFSVGASIGWVRIGGIVAADLELGTNATALLSTQSGETAILAKSNARGAGVSVGAMGGGGTNIGAGAGISRHNQAVRAGLTGAGAGSTVTSRAIRMEADSDGRSWAIAGQLTLGTDSGAAVGGTLAVSSLDATSLAVIDNVTVANNALGLAAPVSLRSRDDSRSLALALTGAVSGGGSAVGISVGVNRARGLSRAVVRDATILTTTDVSVTANRAQVMNSFVLQVSVGGGEAGVGMAVAISDQRGAAEAEVLDSTVSVEAGSLLVRALSESRLSSASVGVAAGGQAGISGSVSIILREDEVSARIVGSTVTAADTVLVQALAGGSMGGAGGGDAQVARELENAEVDLEDRDAEDIANDDPEYEAEDEDDEENLEAREGGTVRQQLGAADINFAFGGTVGIGASVAVLRTEARVNAEIIDSQVTAHMTPPSGLLGALMAQRSASEDWLIRGSERVRGVVVQADNQTRLRALGITGSGAGTAAVSVQVPVLLLRDDVAARVVNSNLRSGADVRVFAGNQSDIGTLSVVAAVGGSAGVGALVEVASLKKQTRAEVLGSTVEAADDIRVIAISPEKLGKLSLAAGGGGFVGAAGIVETLVSENRTDALVGASTLTAGRDVRIEAVAPRLISHAAGTVGIGGAGGIAGTVMVINARDWLFAGTNDAESADTASALQIGRDLTVRGQSTLTARTTMISGAFGGTVGISGQVLVTGFEQSVVARIGDRTRFINAPRHVTVHADQEFTQRMIMGSMAGGGVAAIGGTVGVTNVRNTVEAAIGSNVTLNATGNLRVMADGVRNLNAVGVAGAGAGIVALQAVVLIAGFAGNVDDDNSRATMIAIENDMAGDPFEADVDNDADYEGSGKMDLGDAQLGGLFAEARGDRQSVDFSAMRAVNSPTQDLVAARIGAGSHISAGLELELSGFEGGDVRMLGGAAAIGLGGVAAGVVVLRRQSDVLTEVGAGARLHGHTHLLVSSRGASEDGNLTAFAAGAGLVGIGAAVSRTIINRNVRTRIGEGADLSVSINGNATIRALEQGEAKANVLSVALGAAAIGVTTTRTNRSSTVAVDFMGDADVSGNSVFIEATRRGDTVSNGYAAAGGIFGAGVGVDSKITDSATVRVDLGTADIVALNTISVKSEVVSDIHAMARGVVVAGGLSIGYSNAEADLDTTITIIGSPHLRADSVRINAVFAGPLQHSPSSSSVFAEAFGSAGGGLAAGQGVRTMARSRGTTSVDLTLRTSQVGDITVLARENVVVEAASRGQVFGGGVALGSTVSSATSRSIVETTVNTSGGLTAFGDVTIGARGIDRTSAASVSGVKGFGGGIQAAQTTVSVQPTTKVALLGGGIAALGAVEIGTDRDSQFSTIADSRLATGGGYSGSRLNSVLTATIATTIEADILAPTIRVLANQRLAKSVGLFNGQTRVGSVVSGSSIESTTNATINANIAIAPGVTLRQATSPLIAGDGVLIALTQDVDLADRLSQDVSSFIFGRPGVYSAIMVNAEDNDITLDNVEIDADDDIVIANRTTVRVTSEGYVSATGTSGAPKGDTFALVQLRNGIVLTGGGTQLLSRTGAVRLLAGRELNRRQMVTANAETRLWNSTNLPAQSNADAEAIVNVTTRLSLAPNVRITAARDVELWSDPGMTDAAGFWAVSRSFRLGWVDPDEINPVFAPNFTAESINAYDNMLINRSGSQHTLNATGRLTVDGIVTAGAFGNVSARINPDGSIETEGNKETLNINILENQQRNAALIAYLDSLRAQKDALLASLGFRSAEVQRLEFEIASLESRLEALGGAEARGDMIVVDPLFAAGGNVDMRATEILGNGVITANGDASINITNLSSMSMEVRGAHIPFRDAGRIRVNDVRVSTNSDIPSATLNFGSVPNLTLNSTAASASDPAIRLRGEYIATTGAPADLIVTGDIENLMGLVEMTTLDGSILIFGADVAAKSVRVNSGGDFFLGTSAAFSSPVRNPAGLYRDYFEIYETMSGGTMLGVNLTLTENNFPIDTMTPGTIRALGSVFIYANTLNIDGRIQSGETNWNLDITEDFYQRLLLLTQAEIAGRDRILVYDAFNSGDQLGKELSNVEIMVPGGGPRPRPFVTGNATVFYNVTEGTLEVEPMLTKGGNIEIVGRILSTGGLGVPGGHAELVAAHGYGHIEVNNASRLPLVLMGMNTGVEPVQGQITITDLGNQLVPGNVCLSPGVCTTDPIFRTTTWRRVSGGVLRSTNTFDTSTGVEGITESISTNTSNVWYDIPQAYAVEIVRGAPTLLGAEGQYDSIRVLFPDEHDLGDDLAYRYQRTTAINEHEETPGRWRFHTHQVRGDYPIRILFEGHDAGQIDINSVGDIRIAGPVYNRSGPTSMFATGFDEGVGNLFTQAGNIVTLAPDIPLVLGRTDLEARGDIAGASFASLVRTVGATNWGQLIRAGTTLREDTGFARLDIAQGETLRATSGYGQILLQQSSDDLQLRLVSGPVVRLQAPGSILAADEALAHFTVSGSTALELVAGSGTIGTAAMPLIVHGSPGRIDAEAGGDIHLRGVVSSLSLGELRSRNGDVFVEASAFHLLDANPEETIDRRAAAGLLDSLWDELGLRVTDEGTHLARIEDLGAALAAQEKADYEFYWEMRLDPPADPRGTTRDLGYDPNFVFRYSSSEQENLLAEGFTAEFLESEQQRLTLVYHGIHARYSPDRYDPLFEVRIDADTVEAAAEGIFFTDDQLRRSIREDLILGVTDTQFRIEEPNIIGRNATLIAAQNIGRLDGVISIAPGAPISDEALLALATAERGDITRLDDGTIEIRVLDDIDVELTGSLTAIAGWSALIGSEGDLNVQQIEGTQMVRVKVAGSLLDARDGIETGVSGRQIVLEAGTGSIGTPSQALRVATPFNGATLDARAANGIYLQGTDTLRLGQLFTPSEAGVTVTTHGGDLRRAAGVGGPTIIASTVSLSAPDGSIGTATGMHAPVLAALEGGDLPVTLSAAAHLAIEVAGGTAITLDPAAILPRDSKPHSFRVTGAGALTLLSSVDLANGGDIVLSTAELDLQDHSLLTVDGDITLVLPGDFVLSSGAGIVSGSGNISITTPGDLGVLGAIVAENGDLEMLIEGNLASQGVSPRLIAPNGRLLLKAGQVNTPQGAGLRTNVAGLSGLVSFGGLEIANHAPELTVQGLEVTGPSVQVITLGSVVLDGNIEVNNPDGLATLVLLGENGIFGSGALRADRTLLYALGGGIGRIGRALTVDLDEAGLTTIAARQGDVVLDLPGTLSADVITASEGAVIVKSARPIRVDLVGSLETPDFVVPAGSEIGPWGGPHFDMAEYTELKDALILASMFDPETPVPGLSAPGDGDDQPGDGDDKPGDGDDPPGDGDDKPGDGDDQPGDGDDKPGDGDDPPGDGDDKPGDGDDQPGDGDDKPGDGDDQPGDGDDKPGDGDDPPGDGDDKPGDGDDPPGDGDDKPGDGDDPPGDGDDKPGDGDDQPGDGDDKPGDGDDQPGDGDDKPGDGDDQPGDGDDKPGDGDDQPGDGDDKPGDGDDQPGDGDDKPGDGDDKPGDGDDQPGDGDDKPGDGDDQPGDGDDKPGDGDDQPGDGDDKPGDGDDQPGDGDDKPGDGDDQPGDGDDKPGDGDDKPGDGDDQPGDGDGTSERPDQLPRQPERKIEAGPGSVRNDRFEEFLGLDHENWRRAIGVRRVSPLRPREEEEDDES